MNNLIFDHMRKGEVLFALNVSRRRFPNVGSAKYWAARHGFKPVDVITNEFEYQLRANPHHVTPRNLRRVNLLPGIAALYHGADDFP